MVVTVTASFIIDNLQESNSNDYQEQLVLRPLPRNTLLTSFYFETQSEPISYHKLNGSAIKEPYKSYSLFPRSLGQIIDESSTKELHLTFSQGWWDAENWGSSPDNGTTSGGTGVEVWAVVEGCCRQDAELNWRKLVNTLSGLFCASLNFIDSSHTTYPQKAVVSSMKLYDWIHNANSSVKVGFDDKKSDDDKSLYLLRGALAGEPVCTENLTPFLKLLPCKNKAGIASLLDGHKLFDTQWQSMSIDVVPVCYTPDDGSATICKLHLRQTIHAVTDIPHSLLRHKSGVPRPIPSEELRCVDSDKNICFPLGESSSVQWRLSDIFGRDISGQCPLATNDIHVKADITDSWSATILNSHLLPGKDETEKGSVLVSEGFLDEVNGMKLQPNVQSDMLFKSENSNSVSIRSDPPVYVSRSLTGNGQQRGGLRSVFNNPSSTESVRFVYFETLPWFMKLFLHTLKLEIVTDGRKNLTNDELFFTTNNILKDMYYSPAIDRQRPSQVEFELELPPKTSISLSYDFDKSLIFIEEYPPDANHGFNIAPAVINVFGDNNYFYTTRTSSLLLTLPTPDFSMPYNVIILTCTVMALAFGSVFNLLVKRVVTEEEAEELLSQRPYIKIFRNMKARLKNRFEPRHRGPYPYSEKQENTRTEHK